MSFLTTIRVYNDEKNKRTFLRQVVHDFQVYEDLEDLIEAVLESTKKCFDEGRVDTIDDIDVGYVGSSNNKTYVKTSQQVDDAYTSRFLHKHDELVLFIEQKKKKAPVKRKVSDMQSGKVVHFCRLHFKFSFTQVLEPCYI